jgi:hypothetical protein
MLYCGNERLANKCFTLIMFGFKVIWWALLFIFKLRIPPGVSIATDSNLMSPPQHMDFSDSIWNLIRIQRSFWASGLLAYTLTRPKGIVGQKTYCKNGGENSRRIPNLTIRSICLTNPKNPNPKNPNLDLQKSHITCFHFRTSHFDCKEWLFCTIIFENHNYFKIPAKFGFCLNCRFI